MFDVTKKRFYPTVNKGFTLVEILLVIAMIAILSSAILVAVSGQREKARKSRVLVELSGAIQPMMMCWSDNGNVNNPSAGADICASSGYGIWPSISSSEWSYETQKVTDMDGANSGSWYIQAKSDNGAEYICCNSKYDRCADMGSDSTCGVDTPLD